MSESTVNVAVLQGVIDSLTVAIKAQLLAQIKPEDIVAMRPHLLQVVQDAIKQIDNGNWRINSEIDNLTRDVAREMIKPHVEALKHNKEFQEKLNGKVRDALLDTATKQASSLKIDIRGGY